MSLNEDWMQENDQRVFKVFLLAFGFGFTPAMVGLVATFSFSSDIAIAIVIGLTILAQMWAYRKRPPFGRSNARLVFTTITIILCAMLLVFLGWVSSLLTFLMLVVAYSQYKSFSEKRNDPWETVRLTDLPPPKVAPVVRRKLDSNIRINSCDRYHWTAFFTKRPNSDDFGALGGMSLLIILVSMFLVFVVNLEPAYTAIGTITVLIIWLVWWRVLIWMRSFTVSTENSFYITEVTPWGKTIPVPFDRIVLVELNPPYIGSLLGYTNIRLSTMGSDDELLENELKHLKYPSRAVLAFVQFRKG